ncbi:unnamed protein product [Ectocarpus sp. CCAP 1310/34]|nr:unnamed protein product [Ectocarpus sp. CCAP 1310/34]
MGGKPDVKGVYFVAKRRSHAGEGKTNEPALSPSFGTCSGYYDGTKFHRNIKGFMVQGGDPLGTGKGGESIWGGPFPDEFHPDNKHDRRGMVSMASKGPNTNKSQFFITYTRQPHLNNVYTVFGKVWGRKSKRFRAFRDPKRHV